MLRRAGVRLSDIALRASGRFSVMMATRSRITQSSSSVPVSILVSVVMFPLLLFVSFVIAMGEAKHIHRNCVRRYGLLRRFAPRNDDAPQNFSTHGRNSSSQVQALRGCCSTFQ